MTVRAPRTPQLAIPAEIGSSAPPREARSVSGVVIGGSLSGDVVIASQEALAIVKAGFLVRAFVIAGLEKVVRSVALGGGRTLRLESGFYRAMS